MAFVVEDGTGLADANAGASVEEVDAYHADRGNSAWTGSETVKQQAIVRATDYVELMFSEKFRGCIEVDEQALSFPRSNLYSGRRLLTGVPKAYKNAIAEYALRALSAPLFMEPVVDERGQVVTGYSEDIGPIKESYTYSVQAITKSYPAADKYLSGLLRFGQGVVIRG